MELHALGLGGGGGGGGYTHTGTGHTITVGHRTFSDHFRFESGAFFLERTICPIEIHKIASLGKRTAEDNGALPGKKSHEVGAATCDNRVLQQDRELSTSV